MQINKKTRYSCYGAVEGINSAHNKGRNYKASLCLTEGIISKKEPNLFSEIETDKETGVFNPLQKAYTDRRGKRINLSPFQLKLVLALTQVVDTLIDKPENIEYIKKLPADIQDKESGVRSQIKDIVDVIKLTKLLYSSDRVGGKQVDNVRKEITKLSEIRHKYIYKTSNGNNITLEAPLIMIGKSITETDKNGIQKFNQVEMYFDDIFVYDITDKFCLVPIEIIKQLNRVKTKTDLFSMLFFILLQKRGIKIKEAANSRKYSKENKVSKEKENEAYREALIYKEGIPSILERIDSDRYYQTKGGKTYLRKEVLKKDLARAVDALKEIGIITDYKETKGAEGSTMCNFFINEQWIKRPQDNNRKEEIE